MKRLVLIILIVSFSVTAYAVGELYIVKPHDTLWDISKKFYKNPLLWGKIWKNNTYINDPNLIFPGEILKVGRFGLEIYKRQNRKPKKLKHKVSTKGTRYLAAIWYDGYYYYSACGEGYCEWSKRDFRLARISYDTYNHAEVYVGDTIFLHTKKNYLPEKLYIYREYKDFLDTSMCPEMKSIFIPVGEIRVLERVRKGVYKAKIVKASGEIAQTDIANSIYPYEFVRKTSVVHVGNVRLKQILVAQNELQSGLGFIFFFKASKQLPILAGKKVVLARLNEGSPVSLPIGEGIVISQYKNYIGIYFPSIGGLKEIPDRTQQYVLR